MENRLKFGRTIRSFNNDAITEEEYRQFLSTLTETQKLNYYFKFTSLMLNTRGLDLLYKSINVWSITPEIIASVDLEASNVYLTLVNLSIQNKHYDMLWYLINAELPRYEKIDASDLAKVSNVMDNATQSNYCKLLELLYVYFMEIKNYDSKKSQDKKLFIPIWNYNSEKLKYAILFISKIRELTVEDLLNYYLDIPKVKNKIALNRKDAKNFYEGFLEAGVPLDYFRQIQNKTIPIWLSQLEEDI